MGLSRGFAFDSGQYDIGGRGATGSAARRVFFGLALGLGECVDAPPAGTDDKDREDNDDEGRIFWLRRHIT